MHRLSPLYWYVKAHTRRCRGCTDTTPHSHHLTALGRRRFT